MRNRIAALIAALAIPLFAILGLATPAAAAELEVNYVKDVDWYADSSRECWSAPAAAACIQRNGDDIWIRDNTNEGAWVHVYWWDRDGSRHGTCTDNLGSSKVWTMCNKDWTDGHEIAWYLEYYDDGQWWSGFTQTTVV
jgi:hypothetical protein